MPRRVFLVVLLLLAAGGLWLAGREAAPPPLAPDPGQPSTDQTLVQAESESADDQSAKPDQKPAGRQHVVQLSEPPVEARQPGSRQVLTDRIRPEPDLALSQTTLADEWKMSDYIAATANPDAIDGATAFAAYEFARSCVGEPRSDEQFEFRLEQYSQYADNSRRRVSSRRLDRAMDRLQDDFLRCEDFADEDLVKTASDWLMLAADLEYLPALVRFYQELPSMLRETQARVFREPHYLDLHRAKSLEYLDRALLTGHPRAFLAMSIAITDGVVFEKDPVAAHAYLFAASLAAGGRDPQIEDMRASGAQTMSSSELAAAQGWGRNLCWDYCQLSEPATIN